MTTTYAERDVVLRCSALGPEDLFVQSLTGHEGLSRLFEFEVTAHTTFGGALDERQLDALLEGAAYVAFGAAEEHRVHGVIREVEMLPFADPAVVAYRLTLVPAVHATTHTLGSWVYQDLSVPEILKDVLKEAGFAEDEDFELALSGTYPKKEYVVQYQETDFNFLSRLMEHEGIFYFFEHGDERERLVITDQNNRFSPIPGLETLPFNPTLGTTDPEEGIVSLSRTRARTPKRVAVRDYNYRTPSVALAAGAEVHASGTGEQVLYGEHFKTTDEGQRLARVRAQELLVSRDVFRGQGRVRALRSGDRFKLESAPHGDLNQEYVVTEVFHSVVQATGSTGEAQGNQGYTNDFRAIPSRVVYRSARLTPRPRIYGVMHGKIDAPGDDTYAAPIDELGRYKVLLPYDLAGSAGGRASRWVRMAQPSSGGDFGMHLPLHVGTEVLLVHIDGDPDRPIIMSSVPNAETVSPVTQANATQANIRTRHGVTVTFDDCA